MIGRVNEAFGHVYGGQPHLGLAAIDGLVASLGEVAPSDRAWLAYVAGEAHGDDDAVRAAMDLDRADVLATRSATAWCRGWHERPKRRFWPVLRTSAPRCRCSPP